MNISIQTTQKILRLRNQLQSISNISYTFSKVNQKYPLDTLDDEHGKEVIQVYKNLINDTQKIIGSVMENALKDGSD